MKVKINGMNEGLTTEELGEGEIAIIIDPSDPSHQNILVIKTDEDSIVTLDKGIVLYAEYKCVLLKDVELEATLC